MKQKESMLDTKTIGITACTSSNMNDCVTDTGLGPTDAQDIGAVKLYSCKENEKCMQVL